MPAVSGGRWSTSSAGFQQAPAEDRQAAQPRNGAAGAADPKQVAPISSKGPAIPTAWPKHAASTAASPARRARPPAAAAATAAPSPPKQHQKRREQQQATIQLSQVAVTARTERLRSALQQLRAAKPKEPAAGGDSSSCTAAAPPQPARHDGPLPSPPRRQSPPPAQHPAGGGQRDGQGRQGSLDSSLEDLFDEVSLSLLARLRLGGSSRQASPAQQHHHHQQQLVAALSPAVHPYSSPCTALPSSELHATARQVLQQAAAEPEMPLMLPLPPGRAGGSQPEPRATDLQQRLEELCRSLATPPSKCAAAAGVPQHSLKGGPAAASAGLPRRRLAGELVMTRSPSAAAAGREGALLARQPSSASSRLVAGSGASGAGGGSDHAAAERLAALLGQPEANGLHAAVRCPSASTAAPHGVSTLLPPHLQPSVAVSGSWQPAVTIAAPQPAAVSYTPPRAQQQLQCATMPAQPQAAQPAVSGDSGDILEAWRSRRRAAQAPQLADKYSRYLLLQQCPPSVVQHGALAMTPAAVVAAGRRSLPEARPVVVSPARTEWAGSAARRLALFEQQHQEQSLPPSQSPAKQEWPQKQQPTPEGEPTDILERWRARRRQRCQTSSCAADYGALLTLQPPGSLPEPRPLGELRSAPAVLALPPPPALQPAPQPAKPAEQTAAAPAAPAVPAAPGGHAAQAVFVAGEVPVAEACTGTGTAASSSAGEAAAQHQLLPNAVEVQPEATVALPAAAEELQAAAVAVAVSLDVMLEASDLHPAAVELSQAAEADRAAAMPLRLPSGPPSAAASSGRTTPHSPSGQGSVGSSGWSPGVSRMLDDLIGGLFNDSEAAGSAAAAAAHSTGCSSGGAADGNGEPGSTDEVKDPACRDGAVSAPPVAKPQTPMQALPCSLAVSAQQQQDGVPD